MRGNAPLGRVDNAINEGIVEEWMKSTGACAEDQNCYRLKRVRVFL